MNNKYIIEPLDKSCDEEMSDDLIEWLECILDENVSDIWGVSEDLERDASSREYHTNKHVLIDVEKDDGIDYEIFVPDKPKFPSNIIIKKDDTYQKQFDRIANYYVSEAKQLVNETPVGNSKDKFSRIKGFKVFYRGAPACVKIREKSIYTIPDTNSDTGSEIRLSDSYCDFTAYDIKENGDVNIRTYFLAYPNKLKKELDKFIGELSDKEKKPYGSESPELYVDVYYVDTKSKTLKKEVMTSKDALILYNKQNSHSGVTPEKIIYKIEGDVPENRKVKYPSKNKKKMDYFREVERVYGVDLTGDAVTKVEKVAEKLDHKLSEEFVDSFLKALGVDGVRGLDEELIEVRLKEAVTFTDGDTTKGFDYATFKILIESHTVISALHYLKENN